MSDAKTETLPNEDIHFWKCKLSKVARLYIQTFVIRNILAQALMELHKKENVTESPSNCNTSGIRDTLSHIYF